MPAPKFEPGQRIIVKIKKNEWYVGTVIKVRRRSIEADFDDGMEATIEEDDYKHVKLIHTARQFKRALNDAQAKAIYAHYVPPTPPVVSEKIVARPGLVFKPVGHEVKYDKTFKLMTEWLHKVAALYKLSESALDIDQNHGHVAAVRVFKEDSPTKAKYMRMTKELLSSFSASAMWRVQVMAGGHILFSTNGVFACAFYDIQDRATPHRKIGFYLRCNPEHAH